MDRADVFDETQIVKTCAMTIQKMRPRGGKYLVLVSQRAFHAREEQLGQVQRSARNVDVSIMRQLETEKFALLCVFGQS